MKFEFLLHTLASIPLIACSCGQLIQVNLVLLHGPIQTSCMTLVRLTVQSNIHIIEQVNTLAFVKGLLSNDGVHEVVDMQKIWHISVGSNDT